MEWLKYVLGGGAAATIWTVFRGIQMLRNDTTDATDRAVRDMERWRIEADERTRAAREDADWYLDLADYWRQWAATVVFEANAKGVTLPRQPPLPKRPKAKTEEV